MLLHDVAAGDQQGVTRWITVSDIDRSGSSLKYVCKRCMDLTLATLLLILLLPLMLVVAIAIKLDSPGPVFFVQERVGARRRSYNGHTCWEIRSFAFYKFRSMVRDADPSIHESYIKAFVEGQVEQPGEASSLFKLQNDRRVTRVGRILRRTSIDELPQLLNVLKGDMSLVGPRPVPPYEVAHYQEWHYDRLAALPGITGVWQVRGRCRVPFEGMIRMDLEYVHSQSPWLDTKILLLTILAVLSGAGAE